MRSFARPTSKQIDEAVPLLSSPAHERYFFDSLENPFWIEPLCDRGFFSHSPNAVPMEGGGMRYPIWPESQYLARMAKHLPAEVASIFAAIETDNRSVISDMIDAALAMPPDVAVTLVPKIRQAVEAAITRFEFGDIAKLCAQLANGRQDAAAMTLAVAMFTSKPQEDRNDHNRRDEYWYKEGLKKVVPAMIERQAGEFLGKLCGWLKAAVEAKRGTDSDSGLDYSYMWRPAIEEHKQNRGYDFPGALVGSVRDSFELAIRDGKISLNGALEMLRKYPYLIFKRLGVHLVNFFAEQRPDLAQAFIMIKENLDDHGVKHEYAMLVGDRLDLLTPEQRDTWFGWIDAGPDMTDFAEIVKRNTGREATPEDRKNRIEYWKRIRLHWVRKFLEGDRNKLFGLHAHARQCLQHSRIHGAQGLHGR